MLVFVLIFSVCLTLLGCGKVTAGAGAAVVTSSPVTFVVQGPSTVVLGSTAHYSVTPQPSAGSTIAWSLLPSGSSTTVGSIDADGTYATPPVVPSNPAVTIVASIGAAGVSSTFPIQLTQPIPVVASASASAPVGNPVCQIDVQGNNFGVTPIIFVNGNPTPTQRISSNELTTVIPTPGASVIDVAVLNSGNGSTNSLTIKVTIVFVPPSTSAAARFLDQSTFGPTDTLITHVQQTGVFPFLGEQFNQPASQIPSFLVNPPSYCADVGACVRYAWWQNSLYGNDQLRQRVAFALSEMWVVSTIGADSYSMPGYLNTLSNDAFGNWYTLMRDVTLNTAMGGYLNMVNSAKPANGAIANQNFAREMMQIFSVGTTRLNNDGSPVLDGLGHPIPLYTQAQIDGFARAYTGWTYPSPTGAVLTDFNWAPNYSAPMVPVDRYHDTAAKPLLNGVTLPAGQTAAQDLDAALQNLFQSDTLPPFVCKQLIQHLVTSNPSSAYISRVVGVFIDNGQHVRGDLKAVITAILTDYEARAGDDGPVAPGFGHLREPILWLASSLRGLNATPARPDLTTYVFPDVAAYNMSQEVQASPSVFNFFAPSYQLPGTSTLAPEFQLEQTASVLTRLNTANQIVFPDWIGYLNIDVTPLGAWGSLAKPDPNVLLDKLSRIFLHGQMSSQMRTVILNALATLPNAQDKVRVAFYLVISSPQYKISH